MIHTIRRCYSIVREVEAAELAQVSLSEWMRRTLTAQATIELADGDPPT